MFTLIWIPRINFFISFLEEKWVRNISPATTEKQSVLGHVYMKDLIISLLRSSSESIANNICPTMQPNNIKEAELLLTVQSYTIIINSLKVLTMSTVLTVSVSFCFLNRKHEIQITCRLRVYKSLLITLKSLWPTSNRHRFASLWGKTALILMFMTKRERQNINVGADNEMLF